MSATRFLFPTSFLSFPFVVPQSCWSQRWSSSSTSRSMMDEKANNPIASQDYSSPTSMPTKGADGLASLVDHHGTTKGDQRQAIDAITEDPTVSLESFAHLDINKILWKIDIRLVPMLTTLYLLSFLDRGNIGNAKIEGLSDDLHLTGPQYNWCLVSQDLQHITRASTDRACRRHFSLLTAPSRCRVTCCSSVFDLLYICPASWWHGVS